MPAARRKYQLHAGGLSQPDQAYLNALPAALIAVDQHLHIVFVNQSAEMLLGLSRQQALGKSVLELFSTAAPLAELVQRVFADTAEISLYEQALSLPHTSVSVSLHLTPVMGEQFVEQVLLTIDKSEGMHTLAASEWKKETTRAAGVMAAMLAHEVKNPLSGIRGAAQLLRDEVPAEHQPLAELICRETDRIRDLLAQVEMFAADAPAQLQPVNIHEVLQYVLSVAASGFAQKVKMKEQYDPSLPPVAGQRDMLVQLFLNLIKNAAEAMEGRVDATLTVTTTYRSGYRIRAKDGKTLSLPVMVSIEDNGPGIAPDMRERLFEPFVSSKEEGRGLGLAVVAKIASDLHIVVELDEQTRRGARFNVFLPVQG